MKGKVKRTPASSRDNENVSLGVFPAPAATASIRCPSLELPLPPEPTSGRALIKTGGLTTSPSGLWALWRQPLPLIQPPGGPSSGPDTLLGLWEMCAGWIGCRGSHGSQHSTTVKKEQRSAWRTEAQDKGAGTAEHREWVPSEGIKRKEDYLIRLLSSLTQIWSCLQRGLDTLDVFWYL